MGQISLRVKEATAAQIAASVSLGQSGRYVKASDANFFVIQDGVTPTNELERISTAPLTVNVKDYGVKEDYTALADVSTSGTTLTKVGGAAFTAADVGKAIGFDWGFDSDANGYLPGGIENPSSHPTPTVVADIAARDALSPAHQDMVEVTDPSADVGVNLPAAWTGKAFYLRVYQTWLWVNHKARHYTTIASVTNDNVVELADAPDLDVSSVAGFYGTDNFGAIRTLINQFPGKKLQLFFPKEATGYYVIPPGPTHWDYTNGNVELMSNGATMYVQSSKVSVTMSWPAGKSNIAIKGLKFVSWRDAIDRNPTYSNFNNSNLIMFRFGNSSGTAGQLNENYELKDLEFTNIGQPFIVKEQSSTSLTYTKNIIIEGVKVTSGVTPFFFQQAERVIVNNCDIDHEITGNGQHHFYISHGISNMKVENVVCRRGQGYNIQVQSNEVTLPIKSVLFRNIQFEDVVFGFVISGNVKGVLIQNFQATVDTSLGSGSEIVLNVNSGNADRFVNGLVLDGGEISGGGWLYTDFDTGANGYQENVTLRNLKVYGNTSGIFHRYSNLTVENCEFIADNTDIAILDEKGLSANKRVSFLNNVYRLTGGAANVQGFRIRSGAVGGVYIKGNTLIQETTWDSNARFFELEAGYASWGEISGNHLENTTLILADGVFDPTKGLKVYNNFILDGVEPLVDYGTERHTFDITGTSVTINRLYQHRFGRTTNAGDVTASFAANLPINFEGAIQKAGDGDIIFNPSGITIEAVANPDGDYKQSVKWDVVHFKQTAANVWAIWGGTFGVIP